MTHNQSPSPSAWDDLPDTYVFTDHELVDESMLNEFGVELFRVCASRDLPMHGVRAGDIGGWVDSPSRIVDCGWVSDDAEVFGGALVSGSARVGDSARVFDSATVSDFARVCDAASVHSHACVGGNAVVRGRAEISNGSFVLDDAQVSGDCVINCGLWIDAHSDVSDPAHFVLLTPLLSTTDAASTTATSVQAVRQADGRFLVSCGDWFGTLEAFEAAYSAPEFRLFAQLLRSRIDAA